MIYVLIATVVGVILALIVAGIFQEIFDGSILAAVVSGLLTFCLALVGISFLIDAIAEGRIPV